MQPLLVIVGPLIKVHEMYVVVDEQKFKVSSTLKAMDLTFKTFFALDCNCPKASYKLWQFIQNSGYGIRITGDMLITSLKELLDSTTYVLEESRIPTSEEISYSLT